MPDYGFDTIYREISEMVLAELDFRREADGDREDRRQLRRAATRTTSASRA